MGKYQKEVERLAMTKDETQKYLYLQRLLGELRESGKGTTAIYLGKEEVSLASARLTAESDILPNPYLISGFTPNGMGPGNIIGRALVPNRFPGLLPQYCLESIGDLHDMLYSIGGSKKDRLSADKLFRNLIMVASRGLPWYKRFRLWRISWVYFAFVRGLGKWFFFWR